MHFMYSISSSLANKTLDTLHNVVSTTLPTWLFQRLVSPLEHQLTQSEIECVCNEGNASSEAVIDGQHRNSVTKKLCTPVFLNLSV